MEWPGVNIAFRSDSESEAEELLHENEIQSFLRDKHRFFLRRPRA